jgi:hypothetical protein
MRMWAQSHLCQKPQRVSSVLAATFALIFLVLGSSQSASALPAFARKYGLRCSACHESWPMLNYFGQKFKDNGYQLMNDRDAPIWQNPGYWPVTFRIIPLWHRVSTGKVPVDSGDSQVEQRITATGFDLSGLDFHTGGTLEKNVSFYVLPSSDATASFHFETVMARLDNVLGSTWLNVKLGKFELDNLLSEKRILTLTANGGIYQLYHFSPQSAAGGPDGNIFGQMGANQLGVEVMGHSFNDRTRYSAALISSNNGSVGLPYGSNSYTGFFAASQAFDAGKLGVQRVGFYAMVGEAPTTYLTSGGATQPIGGSGTNNKGFSREGFVGQFYFGQKFDVQVVTQHGSDSAWFGQGYGDFIDNPTAMCPNATGTQSCNNTPGTVLAAGSRNPTWNGVLIEPHYVYSPQLIFLARYETIKMSQQSMSTMRSDLGNITTYTVGYRYNPFMTSRAGFAWHNEFNLFHQVGTSSLTQTNINTSEILTGFDFDF